MTTAVSYDTWRCRTTVVSYDGPEVSYNGGVVRQPSRCRTTVVSSDTWRCRDDSGVVRHLEVACDSGRHAQVSCGTGQRVYSL